MTLNRSYKYRLYPTKKQAARLDAWQAACHEVQRACIIQRRIAYRKKAKNKPTWASQGREITQARKDELLPHLADVPSDTILDIANRVKLAYNAMFKALKQGKRGKGVPKPRWAKRHSEVGLMFRGRGTKLISSNGRFGYWQLSGCKKKLGLLKVRMHRQLPEGTEIKQVHITREGDEWYISFSCVIPAPEPLPLASKEVNGVDLGCIHEGDRQRVAIVDDGRIYTIGDGYKRTRKRIATYQRLVDPKRKVKGTAKAANPKSNRTKKRKKRIAKLARKAARQRTQEQQYIARRLVDTADVTAFEDINWQGLRGNGGQHKKGLNRSMSTAAPGKLIELVEEKAEAAGRQVVRVDARNTSQICSTCGEKGKKKDLSVRLWVCLSCGTEHDRDVNAARNIAKRAR